MGELSKEYGKKYPGGDSYFNLDNDTADGGFKAALDFLVEVVIYCLSTRRVVKFDEKEILTAIREAPNETIVGEARDARTIRQKYDLVHHDPKSEYEGVYLR